MINEYDLQPKQKRIEFDSHRISWGHQHGHCDVVWKHSMLVISYKSDPKSSNYCPVEGKFIGANGIIPVITPILSGCNPPTIAYLIYI